MTLNRSTTVQARSASKWDLTVFQNPLACRWCLFVGLLLSATAASSADSDELNTRGASQLFATKLQPLFVQKCGGCHGASANELKGEFDMRSRAALLRGGESGEPAIDFKNPDASPLLLAVRWDGLEMPPKENDRLSDEQIDWIRQWIAAGAPFSGGGNARVADDDWHEPDVDGAIRVKTSGGTTEQWTNRRYDPKVRWAYRPLAKVDVPWSALRDDEPRHPIEAFIRQELQKKKLRWAEPADPRTLIRRATYDLTGLPPELTALAAGSENKSQPATTEASAFGSWVDEYAALLDRLLDSPHYGERMAQHWLDVVRYADSNGFARDEFRPSAHTYRTYVIQSFNEDKPFDRFIKEQIAGDQLGLAGQDALAFLWMGPWEHTSMSVAAVTRQLWLDDVTNSVGVTFLGQQLRCAKCHDHKFDPIPTRDYYSVQAIFADTKHNEKAGHFKIASQKPQSIHILPGGSLDNPGEQVAHGVLSLLEHTAGHAAADVDKGRRAMLANWIADRRNPLTARVIVNRVWQMHFGRGIVATPNDFGKMGADPTHPELLDWLAVWFMDNGWSIKKLHKLIMTSPTYQRGNQYKHVAQASESSARAIDPSTHSLARRARMVDPNNELLSYFPSRRLSAEEIRDSVLAISGELNRTIGGPSVYVEINWEVAFQPRRLMGKIAPPYQPSPNRADRNRRSIYAVRIRNLGHPLMEVLNRPGSEMSCERRDETTVTPQVFTMLHGEFVHERALALADRIAKQSDDADEQVRRVFRAVYGRSPRAREAELAAQHLNRLITLHQEHEIKPKPLPTSVTVENIIERTGEPEYKKFNLKNLANYENDLQPWEVGPKTRALADLCLVLFNSSEFLYVY